MEGELETSLPGNSSISNNGARCGMGEEHQEDGPQMGMPCNDLSSPNHAESDAPIPDYPGEPNQTGSIVITGLKNPTIEKLEKMRKWSINTYKCTKQIVAERLGRGSRTVDLDLEAGIEILMDLRSRYENITKLAQTLSSQTAQILQTQKLLGDAFADLSLKTPQLHEEFGFNADTQKYLSKNGEPLVEAINSFTSGMNTLVNKTIEDTVVNIKQYETARVEYDAYRIDLEELNLGPRDTNTIPKIEQAQILYQQHRQKYEKMRDDLSVKLKLLEENRVKVIQKQLVLLHSAVASFYAGNQQKMDQTLREFHSKLKMPGAEMPSWLENEQNQS
ncbi:arfaptin-1-like [Denticeps clupeoides]|uniref:arfaptin-1-like n=1 Tax=Denticeps clupeoides TaxID=299321 RepID=UPI0010A31B46|nr:arfaptin-1-like [Denticeps clupeoides]XP_028854432.1 arfaptin-1-like [Denticeps clupeoides]XP_028854441.1 arfaptin-1-like [Denticeps clupeoides]XP_028854449.1 arfaptin-1-like [Denticeps clupeoides]